MEQVYQGYYDQMKIKYGGPWYFIHRPDLHSELRKLALQPPEGFHPAKLNLSCEVVDVNYEEGIIMLADGRMIRKDLIIGADGIHVSQAQLGYH